VSDKKSLSDDDKALFRDAVGEVKGVSNDRVAQNTSKPAPKIRSTQQDDKSVMESLLSELSETDLPSNADYCVCV